MLAGEATQEPIIIADEPVTESDSIVGKIMAIAKEHTQNLIIGAGVLLVLILAWVAAKRRGSKEDAVEASGLPEMDDDLDDTVVASPDNVDETLDQLEPVDPEGMREPTMGSMGEDDQGGAETAGDDVIAEADVYISYNLYDQAEELLKDAIKKDPSNTDYQIKLAEVYESDGNQDGFVDYVKSIAPNMDKQSSAWTRIAAIGAALVPGHELFSDQESDDTALFSNEDAGDEENDSYSDENSLDFSMDEASEAESSEQESDGEDEFEEDSGTAIMEAAGMDFGVDQNNSGSGETDADDTMSFSMDDLDEDELSSADDSAVQQADVDETEAFILDDDAIGALNDAKASQEEQNEDSPDDDNDMFIDLDQDSLEKELSADSDSDFDLTQANADASEDAYSEDDDDLDSILNGTSETSIMKVPDFNEDGSLSGGLEPEEDTVSLEQVQKNLTSELETLSFEDADLDLDDDGDDESSLPTLQTKELGRGDVDLENIHDLDEDLTASETGTFEADMLAGEVTEQFDANNLDDALDDLGDFANSSDDLEAPSVAEEIGTKLDLAKAFVDMGDEDAAKETLTEVIDMGDETQIAEAKALLDKLP
jgi:pilus assembly protein FimV